MGASWARLPFPLAAALFAAAIGDPLLERIARAGTFGAGFGDDDHRGAVPMLVACAAVALFIVARRLARTLKRDDDGRPPRSRYRLRPFALLGLVPLVFAFDLIAVFAMESLEARVAGGVAHAGAFAWLGAPVAIALALHLFFSALATFAVAALLRAIVRGVDALARGVIALVSATSARGSSTNVPTQLRSHRRERARSAPVARHAGGRAPPPLPRPA